MILTALLVPDVGASAVSLQLPCMQVCPLLMVPKETVIKNRNLKKAVISITGAELMCRKEMHLLL